MRKVDLEFRVEEFVGQIAVPVVKTEFVGGLSLQLPSVFGPLPPVRVGGELVLRPLSASGPLLQLPSVFGLLPLVHVGGELVLRLLSASGLLLQLPAVFGPPPPVRVGGELILQPPAVCERLPPVQCPVEKQPFGRNKGRKCSQN